MLLTLVSILRTPSFQQLAGRLAADFLSGTFHTEVYLDKVRISDLLYLELSGLQLKDHHNNKMITVGDMKVKIDRISLKRHIIEIQRLKLDSAGFFLERYPGDSLLNFDYFLAGFQSDTSVTSGPSKPWSIYCKELTANGLSFGYNDDHQEHLTEGIDFDHLSFSDIFLNLKNISVIGDSISSSIKQISCKEQSGIELINFSGDAQVSQSGIRVKKALISTGKTSLDLDVEFLYRSFDDISDFLDSVRINSTIRSSLVTLSDIGYFAPVMFIMDDPVMISGLVNGPVSDFTARDLIITLGDFTEFNGDISMKGLPDIDSTNIRLGIKKLTTTPEDIAAFNLPLDNPNIKLPPPFDQLGLTSITGSYEGYFDDFKTDLEVNSDAGILRIAGSLSDNIENGQLMLDGNIKGFDIQLGRLTGSSDLGTVSLQVEVDGNGPSFGKIAYNVDGWLEDLEFKNHCYQKIIIGGGIEERSFNGKLIILDSLLDLGFSGLVDFNGNVPLFDFTLDLQKARFYDLNLADRSEDMDLKGKFQCNFKGISPDSFLGRISVDSLQYFENKTPYRLNHLDLTRIKYPGRPDSIRIRSDYVDADIGGHFTLKELVSQFKSFILKTEEDSTGVGDTTGNDQFLAFRINLKDIGPFTNLFVPFLEVSHGTVISGQFDSEKSLLELDGSTDEIMLSGIRLKKMNFSGLTSSGEFDLKVGVKQVVFMEGDDGTGIDLDNLNILIASGNDRINYSIRWDNNTPSAPNHGDIEGFVRFKSMKSIEAAIVSGEAYLNGNQWKVQEKNLFTLDSASIGIRNFNIAKGNENFILDGKLTNQAGDTLSLYFKNWSLSNFNPFLESIPLELEGNTNGRFGIYRNGSVTNIFAGINISDFSFNKVFFGDAEFKTHWLESDQALALDMNIFSKGSGDDLYKIVGLNGFYYPFDKKKNFDFDIVAQNLNISVLEPLLTSFSSHLEGFATGKLTLHGTNAKPVILGKLKLQRAAMMVDYLNVVYSFSNEVEFAENMIRFNDLTVYDANSNTAILSGGIKHNYFNNMSLDLTIKPDHFMAMDLNRYQNELFYGRAFATGTVRLTGPFENIAIDVDAKTEKGTKVSIPINYSVDVSQNDFIVFSQKADTVPEQKENEFQVTGVSLNIGMNITNDADIEIFLPGNIGNIRAKGNGKLRMGVDPNYYLTLAGTYVIQTGQFVFSLEQLVSRRFDILEGSKISWTGDIYNADVSIIARYRLRTSLEGLGISMIDPEASTQKVIVFTDIRMSGNLFNPELDFGISFPNMQEQTKQAVYAVLDTNDKGLMNQQAISLLVLGSFSSTGTGGTNPVNPAAIVSSTLSNMLSQISNDFNIGINYVPGDQVTSEQLEVALSTQLLDDRLSIDGNIDVSGSNASSQKTSSIVGDINVEYKLTPDGRFRLKAFNRSNDLTLFNDYAPYTQGVGVFYRKEFSNLEDLFKKSASSRNKKAKD
jgi:hypothetical protein